MLFLVQVASGKPRSVLPSMMGHFEEELAEHFRQSDTVIGIDDSRIILLGFSTGTEGVESIQKKIDRVLKQLLGEEIQMSMGFSLFPEEARSLTELMHLAELKRKEHDRIVRPETQVASSPQAATADVSQTNKAGLTPLQLCFTKARGRIFKRLLNMDPETLWLGLSRLPQAKQKQFLVRLPFESPLVPVLKEKIDAQHQPVSNTAAEKHFEAIIYQMELEEGLEERKEIQRKVLSKLNRAEALPTLPSIAGYVFKIASNPNSSAGDLTRVIVNDPALTSKLLKIVNSAFYGVPKKIGTVKQAVVILGTDEIMDLAFGMAAAKVFEIKSVEGLYDPKAVWHHSMCIGLIAQYLCQRLPKYRENNLGVFTAGLLHDFGKIFLAEHFPEMYGRIHADSNKHELPVFELEEETFGLNHAVIGKLLASNWNLPEALVQAVAFHHQPFSASSHSQLAAIIGLADYLYYEGSMSDDLSEEVPVLPPQLTVGHWSFLTQLFRGMDSEQLKKMKEEAVAIVENNQDLFAILD